MTYTVSSGTLNSSIPYHTSNSVRLWHWPNINASSATCTHFTHSLPSNQVCLLPSINSLFHNLIMTGCLFGTMLDIFIMFRKKEAYYLSRNFSRGVPSLQFLAVVFLSYPLIQHHSSGSPLLSYTVYTTLCLVKHNNAKLWLNTAAVTWKIVFQSVKCW